jgi:antigen flippase
MTPILPTLFVRLLLITGGIISSIVTARLLGPDGRGVFFFWTTIVALLVQFGNLGLHSSNTYLLHKANVRFSSLAINCIWFSLFAGGILSLATILFFYLKNGNLNDDWPFLLAILGLTPSSLYFLIGTNLLVASNRFSQYNFFELLNRYFLIFLVSLIGFFWVSPQSVLLTLCFGSVVVSTVLYLYLQGLCGSDKSPNFKLIKQGLPYGFRAYVICSLGFLISRLNTLLLEHLSGTQQLGLWSIAAQLFDILNVIPATVALLLLPKIMSASQPYLMLKRNLRLTFFTSCFSTVFTLLFGRTAIVSLYGIGFQESYRILLFSLPGAIALGMVSIISQYLAAAGIPLQVLWIWSCALVLQFSLSLLLIPIYGAVGAMISTSCVNIFLFILLSILSSYHNKPVNISS